MNILIAFFITVAVISLIARLYIVNDKMIQFYSKGLDSNFKLSEIRTLWTLAKKTELEDPLALFVSVNVLNKCIIHFMNDARQSGIENSFKTQQFLTKLYDYRTRITLDSQGNRKLESTKSLDIGQRLRIILPGKGVFAAKLLSNGQNLIVSLPRQEDKNNHRFIVLEKETWLDHMVSVYFWRKGDAGYAFDSKVFETGNFQGQDCLFLDHSNKLDRTQKRQSVRVPCNIYAQMYFLKNDVVDYNAVNTDGGYRCLLEDISEDGALIRVGGAGKANIRIKLQFDLNGTFVMMYGVVRSVEYNKEIEQSRLHFECTHIDPAMKNSILGFVYNVIPAEEKDKNEALKESENDEKEEEMEKMVSGRTEDKGETLMENVVVQADGHILDNQASSNLSSQPSESGEGSKGASFFGMGGVSLQNVSESADVSTLNSPEKMGLDILSGSEQG